MTGDIVHQFPKILALLEGSGLLLVSDRTFPNVASMVAGEPIRGSWWSHRLAHTIFSVNEMLEEHKDVVITKLLDGKVTFVHRKMWQDIYAIATAREKWQMEDLSTPAKVLLKKVERETSLDTNKLGLVRGAKPGNLARELELRILIHVEQLHTESGAHAKRIETWDCWANRVGFKARRTDARAARESLHARVTEMNQEFGAKARLPWPTRNPNL